METLQIENKLGSGVIYSTTSALELSLDKVFTLVAPLSEFDALIASDFYTPEYIKYIKANPTKSVGVLVDESGSDNLELSSKIMTQLLNIKNDNVTLVIVTPQRQSFEVSTHKLYVKNDIGTETYNRNIYDWFREDDKVLITLRHNGHIVRTLEGV